MLVRSALFATALLLPAGPSLADPCQRRADTPPGVRLQPQVGCAGKTVAGQRSPAPAAQQAGREPGFIDLGNGSQLRIGGRVRMDMDLKQR
jgi:hypothetical protein